VIPKFQDQAADGNNQHPLSFFFPKRYAHAGGQSYPSFVFSLGRKVEKNLTDISYQSIPGCDDGVCT
jgi:hypothetical protein